jgi:hypothetical protein
MQRYSENCVRAPQTSRGVAGARAVCCGALRADRGVRVGGGCAIAAGSVDAAVAAADCIVRSGLARDGGAAASAAAGSVGTEFAAPASKAIGAPVGDAGAAELAGDSAAVDSGGIGFGLAASAAIGGGAGAAEPADGDTASLSPTAVPTAGADTAALS